MKFSFLFKPTENTATNNTASAWSWPTCTSSPKTLSFRTNHINEDTATMFKTINSAYVQENDDDDSAEHPGSSCSYFSSLLHDNKYEAGDDVSADIVVTTGLLRSSDRLLFEPGKTNSILEEVKIVQNHDDADLPKEESVMIMAMDSCDPFLDFRVSMEEMVIAHRLRRWDSLEDLLASYLKVNAKSNHGYIVGAFVDLLLNLSLANSDDDDDGDDCDADDDAEQRDNSCSCSSAVMNHRHEGSFTSPLSFCSSMCSLRSPKMEVGEGLVVGEKSVIVESSNSYSSSSLSCNASSSFSSGFL